MVGADILVATSEPKTLVYFIDWLDVNIKMLHQSQRACCRCEGSFCSRARLAAGCKSVNPSQQKSRGADNSSRSLQDDFAKIRQHTLKKLHAD
jgi:hypothetical protein